MKLLIADDEDMLRMGLAKYIKLHTDRFEKIYEAENGEEALDILLRYQPEVVLLDVQMPRKSGLQVMQEADRAGIQPIIIILSGYDEFAYAQQALKYGARDYLLKPTRSSDILKRIHELTDEVYGKVLTDSDKEEIGRHGMVERAKEYIEEHYYEDINASLVAEQLGISTGYVSTLFSQNMDCGFVDYLNQVRIEHACCYLRQNYFKTYEIAYKVGFRDEKYFSKVFKKWKGCSPSEYRKHTLDIGI